MTPTDIAAWIGAGTGSLALLWDIYKWQRRGAAVYISLKPNIPPARSWLRMVFASPRPETERAVVIVKVTNRGAMPTTLTNVLGEHYTTFWQRVLRKPAACFFVPQNGVGRIPHVLEPGGLWRGQIEQDGLEKMLKEGRVRVGIHHSQDPDKGVYQWLVIPTSKGAPSGAASADH